jgi:hypothetical protein
MRPDPLATLRCWALDVDVAGVTYTIAAQPAQVWLLAILSGSYVEVLPGLLTDKAALNDAIIDGTVEADELLGAARDAIAAAAGTPWWSAARLAQASTDTWVGAELLLQGIDPGVVSLGAYLAAALRVATKDMDAAGRAQLTYDLDRPPEGVPAEEWFDEDAAAAGFMAALGAGEADYIEADAP